MSFTMFLLKKNKITADDFFDLYEKYEKGVPSFLKSSFKLFPDKVSSFLNEFSGRMPLTKSLYDELSENERLSVFNYQKDNSINLYTLIKEKTELKENEIKQLYSEYETFLKNCNEEVTNSLSEEVQGSEENTTGKEEEELSSAAIESLKELGLYDEKDFDAKKKACLA
jgi:hypothetical protein